MVRRTGKSSMRLLKGLLQFASFRRFSDDDYKPRVTLDYRLAYPWLFISLTLSRPSDDNTNTLHSYSLITLNTLPRSRQHTDADTRHLTAYIHNSCRGIARHQTAISHNPKTPQITSILASFTTFDCDQNHNIKIFFVIYSQLLVAI